VLFDMSINAILTIVGLVGVSISILIIVILLLVIVRKVKQGEKYRGYVVILIFMLTTGIIGAVIGGMIGSNTTSPNTTYFLGILIEFSIGFFGPIILYIIWWINDEICD
jgi:hypothetical protein